MIHGRKLLRDEIDAVWAIDRSEVVEAVYSLENGALVLRPQRFDLRGWPPGEAERYAPILEACHDRGDAELFELEPEDIHLECALTPGGAAECR